MTKDDRQKIAKARKLLRTLMAQMRRARKLHAAISKEIEVLLRKGDVKAAAKRSLDLKTVTEVRERSHRLYAQGVRAVENALAEM